MKLVSCYGGIGLRVDVTNLVERSGRISGVVVLVDVLRASTTIITALKKGCKFILPFKSIGEARRAGKRLGSKALLVGEEYGVKIPGFDLNNSPKEIGEHEVRGKIICFRSSNLTRILEKVKEMEGVERILIGGLVNARSVARYLERLSPEKVHIVICGNRSRPFNLEDFIGAGSIIHHLKKAELTDMALAALVAYENPGSIDRIWLGSTARHVVSIGFEEDVRLCIRENSIDIVPEYRHGRIVRVWGPK